MALGEDYTKLHNIRQNLPKNKLNPQILDKNQKYLTRVATNINLTAKTKYLI